MIDARLLLAAIGAWAAVAASARWWRPGWAPAALDVTGSLVVPLFVGLAAARLASMAADGVLSTRGLFIVRGGVQFWPGVAAATLAAAIAARREGSHVGMRLAALTPPALVGYATFEASCAFRDGCPGPFARFGLSPPGLPRQVPVGVLVALGVVALAAAVRHLPPALVPAAAAAGVGSLRAAAAQWLPTLTSGVPASQVQSVLIAILAVGVLAVQAALHRRKSSTATGPDSRPVGNGVPGRLSQARPWPLLSLPGRRRR